MNKEIWYEIFKKYLADYRAIITLQNDCIIDNEEALRLKTELLADIIVTFESEVEE